MFLLKLHIPNWETEGLSTGSTRSSTLTLPLILLRIRDRTFGTVSIHATVTLAETTEAKIWKVFSVLSLTKYYGNTPLGGAVIWVEKSKSK